MFILPEKLRLRDTVMTDMNRFYKKIAIVTGSSLGIGRATALKLTREGATVILNARDTERLHKVKDSIDAESGTSMLFAGDITQQSIIDRIVSHVLDQYGRIDVLINNAGGGIDVYPVENITDKDWDHSLESNLTNVFRICRSVVPIMKKQNYGRIVNVSSVAGRTRGHLSGTPYSAAKAGLQGFTRHLAWELGHVGITVNAVAPGITSTERAMRKWERRSNEEQQRILGNIALHRFASPDEIASAIAFLASDEASYITGITMDVNGGIFMS
ncbi:MAG: SDR family oxidoreductase [Candidatus Electrothrix sp. MAN1_4]|nr:SDR family oxidoreductase [Candidatus Electrothrix sp. MAN1_4]